MLISRAPLRVAVLCSRRAPGLVPVLNRERNRGRPYAHLPRRYASRARWATLRQASDVLRAVAYAQTEWMLRSAWGPVIARSLERIAYGKGGDPVELLDDGTVQPIGAEPRAVEELAS